MYHRNSIFKDEFGEFVQEDEEVFQEKVAILRPNWSWHIDSGRSFPIYKVSFLGEVGNILNDIQQIRDSFCEPEFENSHVNLSLFNPIMFFFDKPWIKIHIGMYITKCEHKMGPLLSVKQVLLRELYNQSKFMRENFDKSIRELYENY